MFGDALRANRTHSRVQGMQTQSCDLLILQNKIQREYGFETLLRRFRVGSLVGRSKFPYGCSAQNRAPLTRPLLCRIISARYARLILLATWDIASRKTLIKPFSFALRTCLALAISFLLITLTVLIARTICSPANIPPRAVCTKQNTSELLRAHRVVRICFYIVKQNA